MWVLFNLNCVRKRISCAQRQALATSPDNIFHIFLAGMRCLGLRNCDPEMENNVVQLDTIISCQCILFYTNLLDVICYYLL